MLLLLLACHTHGTPDAAAALDAGACDPTDGVPEAHAASQLRGMPLRPEGGSNYDPRLAGCQWDYDGMTDKWYDADGRATHWEFIDARGDDTWDDAGCRIETTTTDIGGTETTTFACDNHGYPICAWHSDGTVTTYANTYADDHLVRVFDGATTTTYTWDHGHVVFTTTSDGADATYTWAGDLLVGETRHSAGGAVTSWAATLDDLGRVATTVDEDGEELSWVYDTDDAWPLSIYDGDGVFRSRYGVVCD